MTAREMTSERLAEVRERRPYDNDRDLAVVEVPHDDDWLDIWGHVDALTTDRDEARQEVAALRAQRDEIREAHRVDEEERDSDALRRMATLAVEAQKKLSTLTEAVAWYLELRARDAGSNGAQAEGYANTLRAAHDDLTSLVDGEPATARAAHLDTLTTRLLRAEADCVGASKRLSDVGNEAADREDELKGMLEALTARLEAAKRERDDARRFLGLQHAMVASGHSHSLLRHEHQCTLDAMQGIEVREREAIARAGRAEARADAAEKKLAAIDAPFHGGALHHIEMLHADQRASRDREEALALKLDAAETKLAALVEAADFLGPTWPSELVAWMGRGGKPDEATRAAVAGLQDLHAALRAARGGP